MVNVLTEPGAQTRDPLAGRIPVSIVTGFLGSGKTTLINRLLKRSDMNRVAVIVNELGEQSIDHDLVEVSSEQMTLLNNGCLCCVLRGDLQETLRDMFVKRRTGEIIDFERVVIETTGLADPAPVMHTLMTDTMLQAQYRLDCVVTLVDAVNGVGQLDSMSEAVKQAALADRLVITKADLADETKIAVLESRLRELNPQAPMKRAVNGEIELAFLINVGLANTRSKLEDVERWMGADEHDEHGHAHRHDTAVKSFCLRYERPFTWSTFSQCMEVLTAMRGPDLLRVKGLVNVEGRAGPLVVQGVQHLFHPTIELRAWPSEDRETRLVFITRGIERSMVENLFTAIGSIAQSPAA
ncbi:MAG TPA: GTP-binding protein [Burkholderiales bacterium]|nr:GTP-binding protein [Burkholderiales bacterium]